MILRVVLMALALTVLSACSNTTPRRVNDLQTELSAQTAREQVLHEHPRWRLSGRIAVSDGRDNGSGRMIWQQDGDSFVISLNAPVTRRSWRLSGGPGHARLEGLEGGPFEGPDASSLLREHLGWNVPMEDLAAWVRGMRAAHASSTIDFDAEGLPALIQQHDWVIEYRKFARVDDLAMPTKVFAERGQQRIRLVVDEWSFEPES
ncbi:MAG TPA: lipoprotein insertase outer membrane protein LolB [Chiayiivirga sp.]|nr:lipoprotein insertase outer membrane protein LolB [Chiayiivirga sp.]